MSESYTPEQVLPHRAPMVMLKEIIECGEDSITCSFTHKAHDIFTDEEGRRPAWVGLEYMCQSIAALEGCLLYTSDAADDLTRAHLGRRRSGYNHHILPIHPSSLILY